MEAEQPSKDGAVDVRPEVLLNIDEYRAADETINAMRRDEELYVRGERLVRIVVPEQFATGHSPVTICRLPNSTLRERMTLFIDFTRLDSDGVPKPAHPAPWLVTAVADRGKWPGLRPLNGVALSPILRPDGTVCQLAGYDASTGVYLHLAQAFPQVPESPTRDDAIKAVERLLDLVQDFPFVGPEHRSAFLAALLTPLARHGYEGRLSVA